MYRNTFPQIFKPHYQAMFLYFFPVRHRWFHGKGTFLQIYTVGYADIFIDPHPQKTGSTGPKISSFITSSSMPHYP
jgi:hypothetical protein